MTIDSLVRDLIEGMVLAHDELVARGVRDRSVNRNRVGIVFAAPKRREFLVCGKGGTYRVTVERVPSVERKVSA
jgi:hypothetical protein